MLRFVVLTLAVNAAYGYGQSGLGLGLVNGGHGGFGLGLDNGGHGGFGLGLDNGGHGGFGLGLDNGGHGGFGLGLDNGGHGGFGLGLSDGGYGGYGHARGAVGPISAAIHSTRSYDVIPVASNFEAPIPQIIDVGPNIMPVDIIFRTQSSPMNVQQIHTPAAPLFESTHSEDEPSVLTHDSQRQVIQNYREVIQPLRNIEQKVLPVVEHVNTLVAHDDYQVPAYGGHGLGAPLLARGGGHY